METRLRHTAIALTALLATFVEAHAGPTLILWSAPPAKPIGEPYSITMDVYIEHSLAEGPEETSFSAALRGVPDAGSTLGLFGLSLGTLGFWRYQRRSHGPAQG
jgi:hypothetical protein